MMAMSERVSTPMTLAVYSRRSVMRTTTSVAPLTTWALVMMTPSLLMMKPEPSPRTGRRAPLEGLAAEERPEGAVGAEGVALAVAVVVAVVASSSSSSPELKAGVALVTTAMFTTAGP